MRRRLTLLGLCGLCGVVAACGIELTGGQIVGGGSDAAVAGDAAGSDAEALDDGGTVDAGEARIAVNLVEPPPAQVELEQEGTLGWMHWGTGSGADPTAFNEKASAAGAIPTFTVTGASRLMTLQDNLTTFRWTNGRPQATETATRSAVYGTGTPVFQLRRKAGRGRFLFMVYAGVFKANARFTATLTTPGASAISANATMDDDGNLYGRFEVAYRSVDPDAELLVRWELVAGIEANSNITLAAATLSPLP